MHPTSVGGTVTREGHPITRFANGSTARARLQWVTLFASGSQNLQGQRIHPRLNELPTLPHVSCCVDPKLVLEGPVEPGRAAVFGHMAGVARNCDDHNPFGAAVLARAFYRDAVAGLLGKVVKIIDRA